jgi:hypothetical protein
MYGKKRTRHALGVLGYIRFKSCSAAQQPERQQKYEPRSALQRDQERFVQQIGGQYGAINICTHHRYPRRGFISITLHVPYPKTTNVTRWTFSPPFLMLFWYGTPPSKRQKGQM